LIPEEQYELVGQTPSVVFTCGAVVEDNGEVKLYYGGADTVQCVATTSVQRLIDACHAGKRYHGLR
ncbi:MAG: glycosidase, partial [Candidatus Omnitrophica bacterium]|nr:glycosidase [Candidatus Omnitrophota bacterium]